MRRIIERWRFGRNSDPLTCNRLPLHTREILPEPVTYNYLQQITL